MKAKKIILVVLCFILCAVIFARCTARPNLVAAEPDSTEELAIKPPVPESPSYFEELNFEPVEVIPTQIDPPEATPEPTPEPIPDNYLDIMAYFDEQEWPVPNKDRLDELFTIIEEHTVLSYHDADRNIQTIIVHPKGDEYKIVYRSSGFNITGYCGCEICCGVYAEDRPKDEYGNAIVYGAIGARLWDQQAVAIDPSVIPYGSNVYVGNRAMKALDRGPDGLHIDIYHATHSAAWMDPDANITHSATAFWCDKNTTFSITEIKQLESDLQNGGFFDLNSINMTPEQMIFLIDSAE